MKKNSIMELAGQVLRIPTDGAVEIYRFDDMGRLAYHKDANGNETDYHYDGNIEVVKTVGADNIIEYWTYVDNKLIQHMITEKPCYVEWINSYADKVNMHTDLTGSIIIVK